MAWPIFVRPLQYVWRRVSVDGGGGALDWHVAKE